MTAFTEPEERFDRITRVAARALRAPIALVALVDGERQWLESREGLDIAATPRATSFCAHAVAANAPLVIPDAARDERFADDPLVTGEPHVRFYAGHPLRGRGGEPRGALCVLDRVPRTLSDDEAALLSDLARAAEVEIDAADTSHSLVSMQDRFVRLAAHDLRTPLTSILGYSEMLAEGVAGDLNEKQREMTEVVIRNAERLRDLVEDSLLVLRLEAGMLPLARERVDLVEVARDAVRAVARDAAAAGVGVTVAGTAAPVDADPRLIARAALGLARRAVAESPAGSSAEIEARVHGGLATLAVTDAGPPLDPDEVERVGERFYRASTHDESGSTGLALTIARGVAERHGGRLRVSSASGRGTTATVELPAA